MIRVIRTPTDLTLPDLPECQTHSSIQCIRRWYSHLRIIISLPITNGFAGQHACIPVSMIMQELIQLPCMINKFGYKRYSIHYYTNKISIGSTGDQQYKNNISILYICTI